MKARCKHLAGHSLNNALSAIELYNKPDFRAREMIFSILMVVAWESLLKARILQNNRNRLTSLYISDGRRYKRNRTGQPLTIGIHEAVSLCGLPNPVKQNIERLVEVRDAAVHLVSQSKALPYLAFTLGSASLKNYSRLLRTWFDIRLTDYNFYILPLGFDYPFKKFSALEVRREPESIAQIIRMVEAAHEREEHERDGFHLVCELQTVLVSAKKITQDTDLVGKIDQENPDGVIVRRDIHLLDRYPFTYRQVWERVKAANPFVKQKQLNDLIRIRGIKSNPAYAAYNFRNKAEEGRGPSAATPVIYNDDFVKFAITELRQPEIWE